MYDIISPFLIWQKWEPINFDLFYMYEYYKS